MDIQEFINETETSTGYSGTAWVEYAEGLTVCLLRANTHLTDLIMQTTMTDEVAALVDTDADSRIAAQRRNIIEATTHLEKVRSIHDRDRFTEVIGVRYDGLMTALDNASRFWETWGPDERTQAAATLIHGSAALAATFDDELSGLSALPGSVL